MEMVLGWWLWLHYHFQWMWTLSHCVVEKLQVIWYQGFFFCLFAFITSIGRLIGLIPTHIYVHFPWFPTSNSGKLNWVHCVDLNIFMVFTYVCSTRDEWSTSLHGTIVDVVLAFSISSISGCNQLLINKFKRCILIFLSSVGFLSPFSWLALHRGGADCSKTTLSIHLLILLSTVTSTNNTNDQRAI